MLISFDETTFSQMSFAASTVSSALMTFFHIFSQIESLTTSAYVREVKMSALAECSLFSSLTVNAVNVSITLEIFVMGSSESVLLFFHLLFDTSTCRNVLTSVRVKTQTRSNIY